VIARRDRLEQQMIALVPNWSLQPVVAALQALRGVAMVAAIILAAEIGDFRRFANPRQLMAWLGLVPREHSSGASTSRGAITKAGNGRARRLLIESAWTYRLPARIASELLARSAALPEAVKAVAWKAQVRDRAANGLLRSAIAHQDSGSGFGNSAFGSALSVCAL
jgi:transposase